MGSVKSAGLTSVRPSRAPAWRGPTGLKSPLMMWPRPATSSAFRSSSPSKEVTKHAYGEVAEATPENAAAFLARLVAEFPQKIDAVTTDIRPAFVHLREAFGEDMGARAPGPHPFAVACSAKGIVHKRTLLLSREFVSAETARQKHKLGDFGLFEGHSSDAIGAWRMSCP